MTTVAATLPILLAEVEVTAVHRLSPSFVRIELGSPALADLGVGPHSYDQRFKLILPDDGGPVPNLEGLGEDWYAVWAARPQPERGHMRTYTVRGTRGEGADTRLLVDVVVHDGPVGPAGAWGAQAQVGDRITIAAPRAGHATGGIEFHPGQAHTLLLVGDETAVPAVAAIMEQLEPDARGAVFLEVPFAADILDLQRPDGVEVTWLPRDGAARGVALTRAVLDHLGEAALGAPDVDDVEVDADLWETPEYSSSGEDVTTHARSVGHDWDGFYAWIAGEAKVVTGLRRALVNDLGIDRHQVAFMGYWRQGVAMQ